MPVNATTQPADGSFGSTDTPAGVNAMVEDAMSRARAGAEPNMTGVPMRELVDCDMPGDGPDPWP